MADTRDQITFHFIKSHQFRTFHTDGVWGGVNPRGLISVSFYSERNPIPKQVTHSLSEAQLGGEITELRVSKDGPVREVEAHTLLPLELAKSIHGWLGDKIKELEAIQQRGGAE